MDTYEKKYKEALERARVWKEKSGMPKDKQGILDDIFPELAESEDERIRKELITFLEELAKLGENTNFDKWKISDCANWIAWLEKQGEPNPYSGTSFKYNGHTFGMCARDGGAEILMDGDLKAFISSDKSFVFPATPLLKAENFCISKVDGLLHDMTCNPPDKVEPKFKVGDWITNGDYTWKIVEVEPLDYVLQSQDGNIVDDTISHVDEQFHSFTIEDTKDGDILFAKGNYFKEYTFIYSGMTEDNVMSTYCGFDRVHNNFGTKLTRFGRMKDFEAVYPATKEQRDLLFQKMEEAGYEWDYEKKELKKIEQKPTDETPYPETLEKAIDLYYYSYGNGEGEFEHLSLEKFRDIVHTFVSDYGQKPAWSEEDEEMCQETIDWFEKKCFPYALENDNPARESIKWLKSLKERNKYGKTSNS